MAIKYDITLSTTEPNNDVGLIKIRQADEQTQTLVVQITENGVPKSYEGLQVFFCAKLGQSTGLGIIEQKLNASEMTNPKNGKLEYTMRPEDWQVLGRQTGYFSFRKTQDNHEYTEQFTTRDFYFNIIKTVFSDGVTEVKKDGSTYVWTIEDLIRLFNEYIACGKTDWEEFVEQNKEILESVDPGGKILTELINARKSANADYPTLGDRLDEIDTKNDIFNKSLKMISKRVPLWEKLAIHAWDGITHRDDTIDSVIRDLKRMGIKFWRFGISWKAKYDSTADENYNFEYEKKIIKKLINEDIQPIVYVQGKQPDNISSYAEKVAGAKIFVRKVIENLSGLGVVWESWNEPNYDTFWFAESDSVEIVKDWVDVINEMGEAIHQNDAGATFLVGAFATLNGYPDNQDLYIDWGTNLERALGLGILKYADGFSIHPYQLTEQPEEFLTSNLGIARVKSLLKKYNQADIPIYITETGYSSTNENSINPIDENTQGKWLMRLILVLDYMNIPLITIFKYLSVEDGPENVETGFGINKYRDGIIKPKIAALILGDILGQLEGYELAERVNVLGNEYFLMRYVNQKQQSKLIGWHTEKVTDSTLYFENQLIEFTDNPKIYNGEDFKTINNVSYTDIDLIPEIKSGNRVYRILSKNQDLNALFECGTYQIDRDVLNAPAGGWGYLTVTGSGDRGDYRKDCMQIWQDGRFSGNSPENSSGTIFVRWYRTSDRKWTDWKYLETTTKIDADISKSLGTGITGIAKLLKMSHSSGYSHINLYLNVKGITSSRSVVIENIPQPFRDVPLDVTLYAVNDQNKRMRGLIGWFDGKVKLIANTTMPENTDANTEFRANITYTGFAY